MKNVLIFAFIMPFATQAQFIISAGTDLSAKQDTDIAMQIIGNVTNPSTFNFSTTKLQLELHGATQIITGNLVLASLRVSNPGTKVINGNVTVTNQINFSEGNLKPASTGKLLFTGSSDNILGGNKDSYCDGIFYSNGRGIRTFPVGINSNYTPITFEGIADETGVQAMANASLSIDGVDVIDLYKNWYWQITDPSKINTRAILSLIGLEAFSNTDGAVTVLQSDKTNGVAVNLGSASISVDRITSRDKITMPVIALGKEAKVNVKIHDLITPFGSIGSNDGLFIENIHKYDYNTVTLLDRWGVLVNKWTNYTNDITYDFGKLSPGNYICIVEYGKTGEAKKMEQQMVTVLKAN